MRLSYNWLKKYVALPGSVTAEEVAEKLIASTVEVEEVISPSKLLGNVVVGKVIKAEKHPQADKLKLCRVDVKNEKLQIVCGGSNVREGMLVALAKVGAKVRWHGEGEPVELKPAAIRGIESFGMIAGANEIGLEEIFPPKEDHEIVDLTGAVSDKEIGKPLCAALGLDDAVFEIDNKSLSNRPDLWGHYGMARELAVLFGKQLKDYAAKKITAPKKPLFNLKVEVKDKKLCPRYMAAAVSGVKIEDSPGWLKKEIISAGLKPINNIVDITNYLMLDLGQPMHAFDASQLNTKTESQNSKTIIVRRAEKGEALKLLDESEIELSEDDLVIADEERPLALAGIMGGEGSGISKNTGTVIFESANFNASAIRKSSTRLGLRTDSSARFEKSLDPNLCELALRKAVEMALKLCPGASVAGAVADVSDFSLATGPITIDKKFFRKILGSEIPLKTASQILTSLGFSVKDKGDSWAVKIPTWRATKDVSIAEDLAEEVARVYGYDRIESAMPLFTINPPPEQKLLRLKNCLRDAAVSGLSYDEAYNYSFVSAAQVKNMADGGEYCELDNPLSAEKPFLRRSLLPNLLENAVKNIEYYDQVKIFEIGKVFWPELAGARAKSGSNDLLPRQDTFFTAIYAAKKDESPFNFTRRSLERIAETVRMPLAVKQKATPAPSMHPGRAGDILSGNVVVGAIYEINPAVSGRAGLQCRAAVLEINLDLLAELWDPSAAFDFEALPEFPVIVRDIAFVIDTKAAHSEIEAALGKIDPLVKSAELFDVYSGDKMPKGKKSMAYRLTIASGERTLNSAEAEAIMKKAAEQLKHKFGAEVRS